MARGGARPGAGRPKGARDKLAQEAAEAVKATGMTPLEYLTSIYQDDEADEAKRIEAAKAAAPYVHPRLSNIEAKVDASLSYEERLRRLADGD